MTYSLYEYILRVSVTHDMSITTNFRVVNQLKPRKYLIKARGNSTQAEIARRVGVEQQTYSHWERGRSTPSIAKMLLLEKVLNTPKEVLFLDVFNSPTELNNLKSKTIA